MCPTGKIKNSPYKQIHNCFTFLELADKDFRLNIFKSLWEDTVGEEMEMLGNV